MNLGEREKPMRHGGSQTHGMKERLKSHMVKCRLIEAG